MKYKGKEYKYETDLVDAVMADPKHSKMYEEIRAQENEEIGARYWKEVMYKSLEILAEEIDELEYEQNYV